jgi:hypothetical protein
MIDVICINPKASTKLIKGATYSVYYLNTNNIGNRTAYINHIGRYDCKNFSLYDGSSLDSIPDFYDDTDEILDTASKNYSDQFIKCRYDAGKFIKCGEIYYVEEQVIRNVKAWNVIIAVQRLKIRGVDHVVNPNNFIEIPIAEQRKLKLKSLNGEKIITGDKTRKFLLYIEKEKINIIVQLLSKVLIDINNANTTEQIDIKKSIVKKGPTHNIIEDDLIEFLDVIKPLLKSYTNLKY